MNNCVKLLFRTVNIFLLANSYKGKRRNRELVFGVSKLVTIKVPEDCRDKVKVYAAQNKMAVYEVVVNAVDQMLLRKTVV